MTKWTIRRIEWECIMREWTLAMTKWEQNDGIEDKKGRMRG